MNQCFTFDDYVRNYYFTSTYRGWGLVVLVSYFTGANRHPRGLDCISLDDKNYYEDYFSLIDV